MPQERNRTNKELVAELLRERIYATFALVAVLISIDTTHTNPLHAALIITGTILSLWTASIVATIMSRRMVFQGDLDHEKEIRKQVLVHAPMLLALVFPLFLVGLAWIHFIDLKLAINIAIATSVLLLVGWSVNSARWLHSKKLPTIILIVFQLGIGLGVIALKIAVGH